MNTKSWWASKTIWYGVLIVCLALAEVLPTGHWTQVGLGVVIVALRLFTGKAVTLRKKHNG